MQPSISTDQVASSHSLLTVLKNSCEEGGQRHSSALLFRSRSNRHGFPPSFFVLLAPVTYLMNS